MAPSGAAVPVDRPERAAAPAGAPPEVRGLPVRCNEVGGIAPHDGQQSSTVDQHATRLSTVEHIILKFFTCDRLSLARHGTVRYAGAAKCGHFSVPPPQVTRLGNFHPLPPPKPPRSASQVRLRSSGTDASLGVAVVVVGRREAAKWRLPTLPPSSSSAAALSCEMAEDAIATPPPRRRRHAAVAAPPPQRCDVDRKPAPGQPTGTAAPVPR